MNSEYQEKVERWNANFPIDRWWREKHKIPFNSSRHREVSFLDMYFEYIEDVTYIQIEKRRRNLKEKSEKLDISGSIKEFRDEFDSLKDMKF